MRPPATDGRRLMAFNAVGVAGFGFQLGTLWLLVHVAHVPAVAATAIAVEAAIIHNFICHMCWTWSDRAIGARPAVRFLKFNASSGAVSLVVNVGLMAALQGLLGLHYLLANVAGVVCSAAANFLLADRFVFSRPAGGERAGSSHSRTSAAGMRHFEACAGKSAMRARLRPEVGRIRVW